MRRKTMRQNRSGKAISEKQDAAYEQLKDESE
jgi:hypothetical protein